MIFLGQQWKGSAKFARIHAISEPLVKQQFSYQGNILPYTFSRVPSGECESVSIESLNNSDTYRRILKPFVTTVYYDYVKKYMDLSRFYNAEQIPKFNFLKLQHDDNVPIIYSKKAMNYQGLMKFGMILPIDRARVVRYLKADKKNNIYFSYNQRNAKGGTERVFLPKNLNTNEAINLINIAKRHTMVELYKNNYYEHCVQPIERCEHQTICVISLIKKNDQLPQSLKPFQDYIHARFPEDTNFLTRTPLESNVCAYQFAYIQLNKQPKLEEFINKHKKASKTDSPGKEYLILGAENEKFMFVQPKKGSHSNVIIT